MDVAAIMWSSLSSVAVEFDEALRNSLDLRGFSHSGLRMAIQHVLK